MTHYLQDNYEIEYYRIPSTNDSRISQFAPSVQSLKAAQDVVRRYEKRRRAAAKLVRQSRGPAAPLPSAVGDAVSDNIIPFRSPVWTRPSSRLVYSRHPSPPHPRSSAPHAKRASLQQEARRLSRYIRTSTAPPISALRPAMCDDVQSGMLDPFAVMAIQALAVVLGLGALLALLTLI